MYTYIHKVKYYETDKMGITHHSNYIRFMEEARIEWMEKIGFSYKKCEEIGLISPVLSVKCDYKKNSTFDDIINIEVKLKEYNGLKLKFEYVMKKDSEIIATGETEHCFINKNGIPIRIKKDYSELNEILNKELNKNTI